MAKSMQPAALLIDINDLHALGLADTKGLLWVTAFYWDQDDQTRAFAQRFFKIHHAMPTMFQASIYSAMMHYLKAIDATGTDEAKAVMAKMKATPIEDFMTHGARIRDDGRVMRDMYVMRVKTPAASKGEWDMAELVATIPAAQAFRPLSESECPLVKH